MKPKVVLADVNSVSGYRRPTFVWAGSALPCQPTRSKLRPVVSPSSHGPCSARAGATGQSLGFRRCCILKLGRASAAQTSLKDPIGGFRGYMATHSSAFIPQNGNRLDKPRPACILPVGQVLGFGVETRAMLRDGIRARKPDATQDARSTFLPQTRGAVKQHYPKDPVRYRSAKPRKEEK